MGEMVIDVTKLEKKTRLSLYRGAPNRALQSLIESILLAVSNSLVPSFGWKGFIRRRIDDLRHRLFGYHGTPYGKKMGRYYYLCTPLSEGDGRKLLISNGFTSVHPLPDVLPLVENVWVKIVWYYDGGSDGSEEYESHNKRVIQYFNDLDS
jgi:hypothetical protein